MTNDLSDLDGDLDGVVGARASIPTAGAPSLTLLPGKIVGTWIGPANKARVVGLVTPHL